MLAVHQDCKEARDNRAFIPLPLLRSNLVDVESVPLHERSRKQGVNDRYYYDLAN